MSRFTVLPVLIAGIVTSTVFAIGQARARAETDLALTKVELIAGFLEEDVLNSAYMVKGRDATVIDVLNAAGVKLDDGAFKDEPLVEASIRMTISWTYCMLGIFIAAEKHQERAYGICKLCAEMILEVVYKSPLSGAGKHPNFQVTL